MKFSHVPAWGFGKSKKLEIEKTDPLYNPGPGQYAPKKGGNGPTWRIGSALRENKNSNKNPGPGQYDIPNKIFNGPKYSIATKSGAFDPTKNSFAPGPGQYNATTKNRPSSAKYTMRAKPYPKNTDITPGPGNYNLRTEKQLQAPSYIFGKDKKKGLEYDNARYVPGPGNYEYTADILHEKHPKFSFGKEIRGDNKSYKTPGPGQYEYKNFIGKEGPRITMSAKFRTKIGENNPGPGQYDETNTNKYKNKTPSYRIGTAKRQGLYNSIDNPGPGQYAPDRYTDHVRPKTPSWKIGTGKRPDLNPGDKSTPGVGNYDISKSIGGGPKYSMVGKGNIGGIGNKNPGPGQYNNSNAIYRKNPSWKIGTSQRDDELKRVKREGVPGPGTYEYDDRTKNAATRYKFGSEKRGYVQKSDTPCPGQYRIPCSFDDINDYTRQQGIFDPKFRYV
jgi:hypothetical protein